MTTTNILMTLICVLLSITQVNATPTIKPDNELRLLLIKAINDSHSFNDRFDAEVWLVDMSARLAPRVPDAEKRISMLKQIHYEATRAGLYPELVLAVIDVESNFNRYAISRSGAMGLMQVMPFWLNEIGKPGDNLFDLKTNLRLGCTILHYYLGKEKGDLTRALARYNGSRGSYRYTKKVYHALDARWRER
ncbi:MAG TPA: lytic transglycosylase domain-containing protein [Gammaproteobacteria bacterium]|nr:lytic transglycosylase domain-containing protein [Gammaproteobacteria bacterium]